MRLYRHHYLKLLQRTDFRARVIARIPINIESAGELGNQLMLSEGTIPDHKEYLNCDLI